MFQALFYESPAVCQDEVPGKHRLRFTDKLFPVDSSIISLSDILDSSNILKKQELDNYDFISVEEKLRRQACT
jgi:hypothetical protein